MRRKIAAANWKMNLRIEQGVQLLDNLLGRNLNLEDGQLVVFAVPFPIPGHGNGESKEPQELCCSSPELPSKVIRCIYRRNFSRYASVVGSSFCCARHSERREYNGETNALLAEKINTALATGLQPIFCCGEPLQIREEGTQNSYVEKQLQESLFHLTEDQLKQIVIAYEPIWAIGTGKTATAEQAQEMHLHLRNVLQGNLGKRCQTKSLSFMVAV
jgi:triosephosphate isomerase